MKRREDKDTRYYIDLDLKARKILNWAHSQRHSLEQELSDPDHRRIFLTRGQYNKLVKK